MNERKYYGIGLMSGTSLDGVDLCYVQLDVSQKIGYKILNFDTIDYQNEWKKRLVEAFLQNADTIRQLHLDYGEYLGILVKGFIEKNNIINIDFIASHGHTIFHKPEEGFTLQIGDGQAIADLTGHKVICDFRSQDVALGGQGAPLVPIGDRLLFGEFDACLNLGGFVNISYEQEGKRIAYDICPINIVLNYFTEKLGKAFDKGGELASEGNINLDLLESLNELDYYKKQAPKSLGFEWVVDCVIPLIDEFELEVKDVLRTFVEHVAIQIAKALNPNQHVLITGGGVFNTFFISRLKHHFSGEISIPTREIIECKEALIFALLGLLKMEGVVNVLSSVTGAKEDHSSGMIFLPNP